MILNGMRASKRCLVPTCSSVLRSPEKTNLVFFIVESTKGLSQIDIRLRPLITEVRKIQKEIDDEEEEAKEKVCVQCRYCLASTIFSVFIKNK